VISDSLRNAPPYSLLTKKLKPKAFSEAGSFMPIIPNISSLIAAASSGL